jgi:hypothetical protein
MFGERIFNCEKPGEGRERGGGGVWAAVWGGDAMTRIDKTAAETQATPSFVCDD